MAMVDRAPKEQTRDERSKELLLKMPAGSLAPSQNVARERGGEAGAPLNMAAPAGPTSAPPVAQGASGTPPTTPPPPVATPEQLRDLGKIIEQQQAGQTTPPNQWFFTYIDGRPHWAVIREDGTQEQFGAEKTGDMGNRGMTAKEREAMAQIDQRAFARSELARARGFNPLQSERAQATLEMGRRQILENEQSRLQQAQSALASTGLSGSGLGQRMLRAERELTAETIQKFTTAVTVEELSEAFRAEQNAINNLLAVGESELAFFRQRELAKMQIDAAVRIAEEQASSSLIGDIFSAGATAFAAVRLASGDPTAVAGA